jgi:hypothetical protein
MGTEIGRIKDSGSRGVELEVVMYPGGKSGLCIQVTGITEEDTWGYIQLNKKDIIKLINIWQKAIGPLDLSKIKPIKPIKKSKLAAQC